MADILLTFDTLRSGDYISGARLASIMLVMLYPAMLCVGFVDNSGRASCRILFCRMHKEALMRKRDYLTLSATLSRQLSAARYTDRSGRTTGAAPAVLAIIQETAASLSVDRDRFLTACGIDPRRDKQ